MKNTEKHNLKTLTLIFVTLLIGSCQAQNYAALTFDDGPDSSYTELILDILKKEEVKATFFVIGDKVAKNPVITKRIDSEGHLIANHSRTHTNFTTFTDSTSVLKEVTYTDSVIVETIGKKNPYFRPPYGALREEQKTLLEGLGYEIVMWTISTKDWDVFNITKDHIINSVKTNHHNHAVILLHSKDASGSLEKYPLRDNTLEALPEVIKFLKDNNYQLVTIDKINSKISEETR